ncbi:hypothetical protein [Lacipirellula sp.]|uniref:hypothetical protein n=1 Tax=Lacipirellula sp. TaxID=2691419 RepID=UPI003D1156CF
MHRIKGPSMSSSSSSSLIEPAFLRLLVRKNELIAVEQLVRILEIYGRRSKGIRARIDAAVEASADLSYGTVEINHLAVGACERLWTDSDPVFSPSECVLALQANWVAWRNFGSHQVLHCGNQPLNIPCAIATAKILRTSAWIGLRKANDVIAKTWEIIPDERWRFRSFSCAALYISEMGQKTLAVFPCGMWTGDYPRGLEAQVHNIIDYANLQRLSIEVYSLRIPGRRWPGEETSFDKRRRMHLERQWVIVRNLISNRTLFDTDLPDVPVS